MNDKNVYEPPSARVHNSSEKPPLAGVQWAIVTAILFQLVFAGTEASQLLRDVASGMTAPYGFLLTVISHACLAIGAILVVVRSRTAPYLFALATAFAVATLFKEQYILNLVLVAVSVLAVVGTSLTNRSTKL